MKKAVLCLVSILFIWGCAHTYEQIDVGDSQAYQKLRSNGSVYILVPEDGKYGIHTYPSSGPTTALVVRAAFEKSVNRVQLSTEEESVELGLIKAKTREFTKSLGLGLELYVFDCLGYAPFLSFIHSKEISHLCLLTFIDFSISANEGPYKKTPSGV